jgi:aminopeptidase
VTKEQWAEMGYNDSAVHTDIVSTENREVYAILESGEEKLIYIDGKFVI